MHSPMFPVALSSSLVSVGKELEISASLNVVPLCHDARFNLDRVFNDHMNFGASAKKIFLYC